MKGIVIYQGKYGGTQQYAEWIGGRMQLPITTPDNFSVENLKEYDFVLLASSVYIGKMLLRDWIKQHEILLIDKMVFFAIVCMTPDSDREGQMEIVRKNIPPSLIYASRIFFLMGRLVKSRLSWGDRIMLAIGAMLEKDPVKKKSMRTDLDGVKIQNLNYILKEVNNAIRGQVVV